MKIYGVVTMDLIRSKQIKERDKVQQILEEGIKKINNKYIDFLAAPIGFTSGDEWQVFLSDPSQCYNIIDEFQQYLWKYNILFYAGIGIGTLSTKVYKEINKIDGPCFHMARAAIDIAKGEIKEKNKYILSKKNKVFFSGDIADQVLNNDENIDTEAFKEAALSAVIKDCRIEKNIDTKLMVDMLNTVIENNEILKAKMTDKQKMTYTNYLNIGSYRKMIENNNNITIGAISQRLNNAEFFTIQKNKSMIELLLRYYSVTKEVEA